MGQRLALTGVDAKTAVLEGLRRSLATGELVPGQRLIEAELSAEYGATRGGVRAAIDELVTEGQIERIAHRGARVRTVSLDEAVEILECRAVLEGLMAAKAAGKASAAQRSELLDLGRAMGSAVASGELMQYSGLNVRLHRTVEAMSDHSTAADLTTRLKSQIVRQQFQLSLRPGRPHVSLPQHLAIIDAIVAGDAASAETAARAHVQNVADTLRSPQ